MVAVQARRSSLVVPDATAAVTARPHVVQKRGHGHNVGCFWKAKKCLDLPNLRGDNNCEYTEAELVQVSSRRTVQGKSVRLITGRNAETAKKCV